MRALRAGAAQGYGLHTRQRSQPIRDAIHEPLLVHPWMLTPPSGRDQTVHIAILGFMRWPYK